jgi:hypothetical protein
MSKIFPQQPDVTPVFCTDKKLHNQCYLLESPYFFENQENKYTIPSGFIYDGASIPRLLWTPLGVTPDGIHRAATLIHDYLYVNKMVFNYSRKEVDEIFYNHLLILGMNKRKAKVLYFGVRIFGWTMGKWPKK